MARKTVVDPADAVSAGREEAAQAEENESMAVEGLSLEDFGGIPESAARMTNPFTGYPHKVFQEFDDGRGAKTRIYKHEIVALHPTVSVPVDRSGRNQSIGGKTVNLVNPHSRMVVSASDQVNMDFVFDRVIKLASGETLHYAIVKDHFARASICFKYDKEKKRIVPDRRYLLLDKEQVGRLRKCFEILINPRLKQEELADQISGGGE